MKNIIVKSLIFLLMFQALFLVSPSIVQAQEECLTPVMVEIDVKPVDDANKINLSSKGLLPVAVLTTDTFNAALFSPQMAHLSDSSAPMDCSSGLAVRWTYTDVNGDGRQDLVFFFKVQELNLTPTTNSVTLMAHGPYDSTTIHIEGTDAVTVKR